IPVIDKTGLQGAFDIKFTLEAIGDWKDQFSDNVAKLGLRLESQKNPVETLVIEHIEKAPTEN
ncbi:MAG: TIGR03435 family protein, partial [Acidobacteriota bacterium]